MFPRLSRWARLALLVICLCLFALLFPASDKDLSLRPTLSHPFLSHLRDTVDVYDINSVRPVLAGDVAEHFRNVLPRRAEEPLDGRRETYVVKEKDIVNPHPFGFLLNPVNACHTREAGGHVDLLVYIHSAPQNLKKRQSIRETWGEVSLLRQYNASRVFITGVSADPVSSNLLQRESEEYGDIVQADFTDSYRNLTYKAIAGLKWAASYCSRVAYILKTDDDILVDVGRVVKYIYRLVEPVYGRRRVIVCHLWHRMQVTREKKSKWYVSEEEFPETHYPPYCSGSAYLLSGDMAALLYQASLEVPFFWVDDYYITGALIKHMNIKHRYLNKAYIHNPDVALDSIRSDTRHRLFFFQLFNSQQMYKLWRNISQHNVISAPLTNHSPSI